MTAPVSEELASNGRPRSQRPTFGVGFLQPAEEHQPPPVTPPSSGTIPSPATPSPRELLDSEPASGHDEMPDAHNGSREGTSSKGSTQDDEPLSEGFQELARNGVIIASAQVHTFVGARTPGQREVALFLADQEDAERIGDPLARIAERRDGVGDMSPDTKDLLAAMMGIAGYAAKQVTRANTAKQIDAGRAGNGGDVQTLPTPADLAGDVA